eukprot:ANDGO_05891.mRNA.1 hypothetical protein
MQTLPLGSVFRIALYLGLDHLPRLMCLSTSFRALFQEGQCPENVWKDLLMTGPFADRYGSFWEDFSSLNENSEEAGDQEPSLEDRQYEMKPSHPRLQVWTHFERNPLHTMTQAGITFQKWCNVLMTTTTADVDWFSKTVLLECAAAFFWMGCIMNVSPSFSQSVRVREDGGHQGNRYYAMSAHRGGEEDLQLIFGLQDGCIFSETSGRFVEESCPSALWRSWNEVGSKISYVDLFDQVYPFLSPSTEDVPPPSSATAGQLLLPFVLRVAQRNGIRGLNSKLISEAKVRPYLNSASFSFAFLSRLCMWLMLTPFRGYVASGVHQPDADDYEAAEDLHPYIQRVPRIYEKLEKIADREERLRHALRYWVFEVQDINGGLVMDITTGSVFVCVPDVVSPPFSFWSSYSHASSAARPSLDDFVKQTLRAMFSHPPPSSAACSFVPVLPESFDMTKYRHIRLAVYFLTSELLLRGENIFQAVLRLFGSPSPARQV